jgi:hypothetical protein
MNNNKSDSFANVVDLLDDMFERAAQAVDEPIEMNFIKKHALELSAEGVVDRTAARLFCNPYVVFCFSCNALARTMRMVNVTHTPLFTLQTRRLRQHGKRGGQHRRMGR